MAYNKHYRILSIDGGGIRGIIPAVFLSALEEKAGRSLYQYFDLICGTSTGAIIALAIATGVPMRLMLDLYKTNGSSIFPTSFLGRKKFLNLFKTAALYDKTPLLHELYKIYGDKTVRNLKTDILIPSTNLVSKSPAVFKTTDGVAPVWQFWRKDGKLLLKDIAMAASAAPYFFEPKKIGKDVFWDGGLWANNPSLCGLIEAQKIIKDNRPIKMLSLGTGCAQEGAQYKNLKKLGFLDPVMVIPYILDIQSLAIHEQVKKLMESRKGCIYERVDCGFPEPKALDDSSLTNIEEMQTKAERMTKEKLSGIVKKFIK